MIEPDVRECNQGMATVMGSVITTIGYIPLFAFTFGAEKFSTFYFYLYLGINCCIGLISYIYYIHKQKYLIIKNLGWPIFLCCTRGLLGFWIWYMIKEKAKATWPNKILWEKHPEAAPGKEK